LGTVANIVHRTVSILGGHEETMSELAFNVNGEPFDVPPTMAAWRVRKLKAKGAPEVVYGRDGLPLFLPMDADVEDLRREARGEGRYRLDPVDEHNRLVPNTQASYVCVHPGPQTLEPEVAATRLPVQQADTTAHLIHALLESQKQHTELARMYVAQFPVLVNALSGVVRSAGDAGLPARVPLVVPVPADGRSLDVASDGRDAEQSDREDEEDDDPEDEEEEIEIVEEPPPAEWTWPRLAATALERFSPQIDALLGQLPALSATLGTRRAASAPTTTGEPAHAAPVTDAVAHLSAIRAALSPSEGAAVQALADELSTADKLAYLQKLRGMSVAEAVAYVRGELSKLSRNSAQTASGDTDEGAVPGMAMANANVDAHMEAIYAGMTPGESMTIRTMLDELVLDHRLIWIEKLCRMTVPQAVAFLRTKLAEAQRDARARSAAESPIATMPDAAPSRMASDAAPVPPAARRADTSVGLRRDGRRVVGSTVPQVSSSPRTSATPTDDAPTARLGTTSPIAQAHLAAIQRQLTFAEDAAVRAHLAALPMPERSTWIVELLELTVPEAVARIRAMSAVQQADTFGSDASAAAPASASAAASLDAAEGSTTTATSILGSFAAAPPPTSNASSAALAAPAAPAAARENAARLASTAPTTSNTTDATERIASADDTQGSVPSTVETSADAHLLAIEHALTASERHQVHATVAQMSPDVRDALLDALLSASIPEGAAILRAALPAVATEKMSREMQTGPATVLGGEARGDHPPVDDVRQLELEQVETDDSLDEDEALAAAEQLGERPASAPISSTDASERAHDTAGGSRAARTVAGLAIADLPTLAPDAASHFKAIEAALTFAERLRVFELAARLSATELRTWIAELTALPLPDAVARIRVALAAAPTAKERAS
jgi:hypothetical protein